MDAEMMVEIFVLRQPAPRVSTVLAEELIVL